MENDSDLFFLAVATLTISLVVAPTTIIPHSLESIGVQSYREDFLSASLTEIQSKGQNKTSNHPPLAESLTATLTLQGIDENNTNLTEAVVNRTSNGQLSDITQETGSVVYTPNPGYLGPDEFTYKVNDGKNDSLNTGEVSKNLSKDVLKTIPAYSLRV